MDNPMAFLADLPLQYPPARPRGLALAITTTGHTIDLPSLSTVYVGRCDARHNIYPHIDLTPDDGLTAGVSRRHARIRQTERGVFIEDLGSTNGTYVNGQRLRPFAPYPIGVGDVVELGSLKLIVSLAYQN